MRKVLFYIVFNKMSQSFISNLSYAYSPFFVHLAIFPDVIVGDSAGIVTTCEAFLDKISDRVKRLRDFKAFLDSKANIFFPLY